MAKKDRTKKIGEQGEELYAKLLDYIGFEPLRNIYLPLQNGGYTEIDMLIADYTGIYPIEVKNYSAKIYGNEEMKYWKAYYRNGKGYDLYNPIWQNDSHRQTLERVTGFKDKTLSFIVFTDNADLTNVQNNRTDVLVCTPLKFKQVLDYQLKNGKRILTTQDLKKIHGELSKYVDVDGRVKKEHLKYVKKKQKRK